MMRSTTSGLAWSGGDGRHTQAPRALVQVTVADAPASRPPAAVASVRGSCLRGERESAPANRSQVSVSTRQ